jgi:uncharacterized protein YecT (DUF1311 family)
MLSGEWDMTFPKTERSTISPGLVTLVTLLCGVLLATHPARAGQLQDDADALESCVTTGWPRDVLTLCTGIVSDPCQLAPGGTAPEAMNRCLANEADAWDLVLNRLLPKLMTQAREVDAANETPEQSGGLSIDTASETLRSAQRAWIVFRDAECRYNYASWGNGSFRSIAHSACRLDLTARRVITFHARQVTGK